MALETEVTAQGSDTFATPPALASTQDQERSRSPARAPRPDAPDWSPDNVGNGASDTDLADGNFPRQGMPGCRAIDRRGDFYMLASQAWQQSALAQLLLERRRVCEGPTLDPNIILPTDAQVAQTLPMGAGQACAEVWPCRTMASDTCSATPPGHLPQPTSQLSTPFPQEQTHARINWSVPDHSDAFVHTRWRCSTGCSICGRRSRRVATPWNELGSERGSCTHCGTQMGSARRLETCTAGTW